MPSAITDFRCYLAGRTPEDWSPAFGASASPVIVQSVEIDAPEASRLAAAPTSTTVTGLTWNIAAALAGESGHGEQEIVAQVQMAGSGSQAVLGLRLAGASAGAAAGYVLRLDATAGWSVARLASGSATTLGSVATPPGYGVVWVRFRANGKDISAKVWREGSAEPVTWGFETEDATYGDGALGVVTLGTVPFAIDLLGWATNGATAPSTPSRAVAAALADASAPLAYTLRLESYDLDLGAERVDWYTLPGGPRSTVARDYPSAAYMQPLLVGFGPVVDELGEDLVFAGRGSLAPSQIVLASRRGSFGVRSRSYAGRRATVYLGEASRPHLDHVPILTAIVSAEPEHRPGDRDSRITLPLAVDVEPRSLSSSRESVLPQLARPLDIGRFVGIPVCLATGGGTAPADSQYQVKSFAVLIRFLITEPPGSAQKLLEISTSSTARQVRIEARTDGRIGFIASCAGSAAAINLVTARSEMDGRWRWVVVAIDDRLRTASLLTEREELTQATPAAVDTPSAGVLIGYGDPHVRIGETWFYAGRPDLSELRSMADRALPASDAAGIVSHWRFDDGGASTVATDYAPLGNDVALAGTLGVDYSWEASDLGMPEQAGQSMPATEGQIYNALGALSGELRYLTNDRPPPEDPASGDPETAVTTVRARGVELTPTTDWSTPADPFGAAIELVSGASSDPITFDTGDGPGGPFAGQLLGGLLLGAAERRAEIDPLRDVDGAMWGALRACYPWRAGFHWPSGAAPPALGEFWGSALGSVGASLITDRSGRVLPATLWRPINPGPYGREPLLEHAGIADGGVTFPALPAIGPNDPYRVVMWVYLHAPEPDPVAELETIPVYQEIVSADGGFTIGVDARRSGGIAFGHPSILGQLDGLSFNATRPATVRPGEWWLIACEMTTSNGSPAPVGNYQRRIVGAPLGAATVVELASQTVHGARSLGSNLRIGRGLAGSVAYLAVYDDEPAGSISATYNAMLTAPPTQAGAIFYATLTDASSTVVDSVGGLRGAVSGARWCPSFEIDADRFPRTQVEVLRDARPAWQTVAGYRVNHNPLAQGDIAGAVTDRAARTELGRSSLSVSVVDRRTRSIYLRARDYRIDPPVQAAEHAELVAARIARRLAPGALHAEVACDLRLHLVRLLSEVHLRSTGAGLPDWTVWRVVGRSAPIVESGSGGADGASRGTLSLWGGFDA